MRIPHSLLLLALGAPIAGAQSPVHLSGAVDVGLQRMGTEDPTGPVRAMLQLDHRWLSLSGVMSADQLAAKALLAPPPIGPFRFLTSATTRDMSEGTRASWVSSSASVSNGVAGVWVAPTVAYDAGTTRPMNSLLTGAWHQFGRSMWSITAATHAYRTPTRQTTTHIVGVPDSIFNDTAHRFIPITRSLTRVDTTSTDHLTIWSDVQARTRYSTGVFHFDVTAGLRSSTSSAPHSLWTTVGASWDATPMLSLRGSIGNEPTRAILGLTPSRVATFGIRLSRVFGGSPELIPVRAGVATFMTRPLGDSLYAISVYAPDARTVEIAGDFDRWNPVPLGPSRPGVWETTLRLAPGTYRINLRVNGDAWRAPPGLSTTEDEFNGMVGLLIIR